MMKRACMIRDWSKSGWLGVAILTSAMSAPHLQAGPLDDYLAMPEAEWESRPAFGPYQAAIPKYQQAFHKATRDYDKGMAVANLAFIALELARDEKTHEVARELAGTWVVPNLKTTLEIEQTSTCCWRRTVMRCANLYRLIGQPDMERDCLALLYRGNRREGDQDLAVYLLAYQQAGQGEFKKAIDTINHLNPESKWAANRDKLIRGWQKQLNKKQKASKP